MKFLMDRGFKQAVLPPHERPNLKFLKELGFTGSVEQILQSVWKFSPALLANCYSASNMWTANSTVISPSADTKDKKVHFTPANLQSCIHRSLEAKQTSQILKRLFTDSSCFVHHPPLPALPAFSDEGAANHSRFCSDYGSEGVELFVYGKSGFSSFHETNIFPARQAREASEIIALRHKLKPQKTVVARQNPEAIDSGVFHNDVICTADKNLIFYHELAFSNTEAILKEIEEKLSPLPLLKIPVRAKDITLNECVSSYLFNSQLLPLGKNEWMLLAPMECSNIKTISNYLLTL